jgi:DNA-binding CsgD family transcriptional regulator
VSEPLRERFWSRVDMSAGPDGCWLWTGARHRFGYGVVGISGRKTTTAHRLSLQWATGEVGEIAMHKCDNPPCVNPAHLQWGTQLDNMSDAAAKGRIASGERNGSRTRPDRVARGEARPSKLTERDVLEIKASSGVPQKELARRFGVHQGTISKIRAGTRWGHL